MHEPANLIGGRWIPIPGPALRSHNPAHPGRLVWSGAPSVDAVHDAVRAARAAFPAWSARTVEERAAVLRRFRAICDARSADVASMLCDEVGKAFWEAEAEAKLLPLKVDTTLLEGPMSAGSGRARVTDFEIELSPTRVGCCSFRPHGVMAVLGPFNFPVHLPNGHITPALLAGNTVVFKPSDKAPASGQLLAALFEEALREAGAPPGVINLVHGAADVASTLAAHDDIDGVLLTGSWSVGRRILEANLDHPGRIIALELGGNNAAVIMPDADMKLAVLECARAAFATTGQRCTCTRRIIVDERIADRFIPALARAAGALVVGDPRGENGRQPFMGPLIRAEAVDAALRVQSRWLASGASALREARPLEHPSGGHYITPGILIVPGFSRDEQGCGGDVELFAPVVRVCVVRGFDEALAQANATRYGLAASVFTADPALARRFIAEARAGCVNVNTGTAGASGKLPFGGLGLSGNHRPAGSFALDYCAYPVASMLERSTAVALSPGMSFEDSWLA
ncbi:MAG: aldehyde dehydrogenase family protein [Planctomycetota bacterium]|nr:aldehyde dehydrogenase family protein [Planctomycetota bacterium]